MRWRSLLVSIPHYGDGVAAARTLQPELLRIDEVAALLGIGRSKAYVMSSAGTLTGVIRIGRSVRVSRRALERWIDRMAEAGS